MGGNLQWAGSPGLGISKPLNLSSRRSMWGRRFKSTSPKNKGSANRGKSKIVNCHFFRAKRQIAAVHANWCAKRRRESERPKKKRRGREIKTRNGFRVGVGNREMPADVAEPSTSKKLRPKIYFNPEWGAGTDQKKKKKG